MKTLHLGIVVGMGVAMIVIGNSNLSFAQEDGINFCCSTLHIVDSPLKQFKSGTSAKDVKCNQDLVLVIKKSDNSPACVKPDTAQKLVERGWGWIYSGYAIPTSIRDKTNSTILSIVASDNSSALNAVVEQGGIVQIPWNVRLVQNYSIFIIQIEF